MLKVVDLVYYCHQDLNEPMQVYEKHKPGFSFVECLENRLNYELVRHMNYEGKKRINGIPFAFFKRSNAAWQIPFKTHRYIRSLKPDLVLVHGFVFPLQVIALKWALGKKTVILLAHHSDQPKLSARRILQQVADRFVSGYLFTSAANGKPWLDQHVIRDKDKIIELLSASPVVIKQDKQQVKQMLGLTGDRNFLWVGRLNENKDPLTVIRAFAKQVVNDPSFQLYVVYQDDKLLQQVKEMIAGDHLENNVHLIGKLNAEELALWFNAADFYIAASHHESTGYALLESMSVGCIPVVTNIPAFSKILNRGQVGFLFEPGDTNGLVALLNSLAHIDVPTHAAAVEVHHAAHLHPRVIADALGKVCQTQVDKNERATLARGFVKM